MCKADAASCSSRADLGAGFERAFAAQSVLDDRLRTGLAELRVATPYGFQGVDARHKAHKGGHDEVH